MMVLVEALLIDFRNSRVMGRSEPSQKSERSLTMEGYTRVRMAGVVCCFEGMRSSVLI